MNIVLPHQLHSRVSTAPAVSFHFPVITKCRASKEGIFNESSGTNEEYKFKHHINCTLVKINSRSLYGTSLFFTHCPISIPSLVKFSSLKSAIGWNTSSSRLVAFFFSSLVILTSVSTSLALILSSMTSFARRTTQLFFFVGVRSWSPTRSTTSATCTANNETIMKGWETWSIYLGLVNGSHDFNTWQLGGKEILVQLSKFDVASFRFHFKLLSVCFLYWCMLP